MSLFNRVLQEHEKRVTEKEAIAAARLKQERDAQAHFLDTFDSELKQVGRPLFTAFAQDAERYGFPTRVEDGTDSFGHAFISLTFIARRGAVMGRTPSEESTFLLRADQVEKTIEHCSYFDQRPGPKGLKREKLGLDSLDKAVLERQLEEFLHASLQAWEEN
jgi:hypothetical protein